LDIELVLRPRSRVRRGLLLALGAAAANLASPVLARAQGAQGEDVASARVLGTEGVRLAEAGDCRSAIVKLEAAERLYHAPTTLERLGECQVKVGRIIAGTESLNRVQRETLPPNAPPAFLTAQQRAGQVLAEATPRIAKLRIHVEGAPLDRVTVSVDGVSVPSALFDSDRPTDPGSHDVSATAAGYKSAPQTIQLPDGGSSSITLTLEPDPNAVATTPGAAAAGATTAIGPTPASAGGGGAAASSPEGTGSGPNRVPAFVAFGIGGAGLAVGAVFGLLALGTKSTLDNACPNKVCPNGASQSDIDQLSSRATVSSVGFGVGVLGLAVGAVLLVTAHGEGHPAAAGATPPRPPRVRPWIGLGAAGLGGTFE
jgi:hypothetical protein